MKTATGGDTQAGVQCFDTGFERLGSNLIAFDDGYLARLRSGDEETAKHFNRYFRRLLKIKLWGKLGRERQDDLIDEVMAAAIQKILSGEPRDPACLPAYVRGICANLARKPNLTTCSVNVDFDRISDHALSAEETMIAQERARTVQAVLVSLRLRDRNILVDLFYNELTRKEVCEKYGIGREHLRLVLFRARERFQEKWQEN